MGSEMCIRDRKKLEKGGYLERVVDMEDNRFHKVSLTEKGRQVVENSHEIFQQTIREMYQNLSTSDMEQMMSFYEKLEEKLKGVGADIERVKEDGEE